MTLRQRTIVLEDGHRVVAAARAASPANLAAAASPSGWPESRLP
jgi:hypothetical protein